MILLAQGAVAADPPRVLRVAYSDDVASFDPDNAILLYGLDAARVIYEGLVQYRPGSTEITGWLAERWEISADGLTYSFTLRDGVRFHDGRAMNSADVLAYFERRREPSLPLSYFLANVDHMAAPDPRTFIITLKAPEPAFLDRLASPWAPKVIGPGALIGHEGGDHGVAWLNEHEDGTGPFRLTEFTRGQRYVLTRNPDYWGQAPWFDRIEILIIPGIGQQMLMLQRGLIDIVEHGYPFDQLTHLPQGLAVEAHDALAIEMAYVNQVGVLKDADLRKAVLTAIAPSRWLHDAFGPFAAKARSLYPKAMIDAPDPVVFPADLAEAARIVRAHGPVSLEIAYADEEESVQQRPAEFMVSLLKEIGITATVRVLPLDQESSLALDLPHAPDLFLAQNFPDAAHPATHAGVFFETGAALNLLAYSNPAIDAAIDAAGQLTDIPRRTQVYLAIGQSLFDDVAFIPLADIKDVLVYRTGLRDLNTRPALPWAVDYGTIRRD